MDLRTGIVIAALVRKSPMSGRRFVTSFFIEKPSTPKTTPASSADRARTTRAGTRSRCMRVAHSESMCAISCKERLTVVRDQYEIEMDADTHRQQPTGAADDRRARIHV